MTKFLWELVYTEKYESNWEEKKKYTNVWWLFLDEEKWYYSVKFLWQWLNVFPKKDKAEKKQETISDDDFDSIPF